MGADRWGAAADLIVLLRIHLAVIRTGAVLAALVTRVFLSLE